MTEEHEAAVRAPGPPTDPTFDWYRFDELGVGRLYDVLRLRLDVFVLEQSCLYRELDGRDQSALHLLATAPGAVPVALAAQSHLRGYYEGFGFVVVSEEYLDDGDVPHVDMRREP